MGNRHSPVGTIIPINGGNTLQGFQIPPKPPHCDIGGKGFTGLYISENAGPPITKNDIEGSGECGAGGIQGKFRTGEVVQIRAARKLLIWLPDLHVRETNFPGVKKEARVQPGKISLADMQPIGRKGSQERS